MSGEGPGLDAFDPAAASPPPPVAPPLGSIELSLAPEDLPRLARLPSLVRIGASRPANLVWYDAPDGSLAEQRLSLVKDGRHWRLERLQPGGGQDWAAAAPAPVLAESESPATLDPMPPFDAAPIAAFQGRRRVYRANGAELLVLHGALRGVVAERRVCRIALAGPQPDLLALAQDLADALRVRAPRASLALEAASLAKGTPLPPRHVGAPDVPPDHSVSDSLAHIIGHLLDAMLHWADRCTDGSSPEPVHQARVAMRRLRSALSIFKRAAGCPELAALAPALKDCAARLGAARDWDVFLGGTGARLAETNDRRIAALLRTARRRRAEAYAELNSFLAGPDFRRLELALACVASLRPWDGSADPAQLQRDTAAFAADVLERRLKRVRRAGRALESLPVPLLHELRKDCKRLRYAAEFFAPVFPARGAKSFLKRLAQLQEELGLLNDSAVASGLMGQLGRVGRGYAGGLVEGWAAAEAGAARPRIVAAWARFRAARRFWA